MTGAAQIAELPGGEAHVAEVVPVCPCCKEEVDGDRYSFIDEKRLYCNRVWCVKRYEVQYRIQVRRGLQRSRKFCKIF